jgi:uncharacterized protein (DUF934 family)
MKQMVKLSLQPVGFQPVSFVKILRDHLRISLSEAMQVLNKFAERSEICVEVSADVDLDRLLAELRAIAVVATVVPPT